MKKITVKKEGILADYLRAVDRKGVKNIAKLADADWEIECTVKV